MLTLYVWWPSLAQGDGHQLYLLLYSSGRRLPKAPAPAHLRLLSFLCVLFIHHRGGRRLPKAPAASSSLLVVVPTVLICPCPFINRPAMNIPSKEHEGNNKDFSPVTGIEKFEWWKKSS